MCAAVHGCLVGDHDSQSAGCPPAKASSILNGEIQIVLFCFKQKDSYGCQSGTGVMSITKSCTVAQFLAFIGLHKFCDCSECLLCRESLTAPGRFPCRASSQHGAAAWNSTRRSSKAGNSQDLSW